MAHAELALSGTSQHSREAFEASVSESVLLDYSNCWNCIFGLQIVTHTLREGDQADNLTVTTASKGKTGTENAPKSVWRVPAVPDADRFRFASKDFGLAKLVEKLNQDDGWVVEAVEALKASLTPRAPSTSQPAQVKKQKKTEVVSAETDSDGFTVVRARRG